MPCERTENVPFFEMRSTIPLALTLCSLLILGCGSYRVIEAWELPNAYRGWVVVERANPKCPQVLLAVASVVLKVPPSGRGCFSTPLPKHAQYLRFFELDTSGHRHPLQVGSPGNGGQIWEFMSGGSSNEFVSIREANEFFVGTEAEYQSQKDSRPQWWRMKATGEN
jgi:hypothetical protein